MQTILGVFLATMMVASATTLEILEVFQPLSLHGTDVVAEFQGKGIQAKVMPRPMVLSGAMPESLVAAVGAPLRLAPTGSYDIPECNLLALYGVAISGNLEKKSHLVVSLDVSRTRVPDEVDLPIRTVLELSVAALKKTLAANHHPENREFRVTVKVRGLTGKNASLKDLGETFRIPSR